MHTKRMKNENTIDILCVFKQLVLYSYSTLFTVRCYDSFQMENFLFM